MILEDDRTPEQKLTHTWAVIGTDTFMSGWGGAEGGMSYAGWACPFKRLSEVETTVRNRSDMQRVRVVKLDDYHPRAAHTHIYVFDEDREEPYFGRERQR